MTHVWLLTVGCYEDRCTVGVYATAELAMQAHGIGEWSQDEDGDWVNDGDWEDFAVVRREEIVTEVKE